MTAKQIIERLLRIKAAADGGKTLLSNQGQAMDGYSELAAYRQVLSDYVKTLENAQNDRDRKSPPVSHKTP